ncbi:hypothetical protein EDB89DRAFT_185642 [Lactarius sanguifluus]|nr:hypothetical protein EDB89DRAFT_185642 [Lactarius sanguifluus]
MIPCSNANSKSTFAVLLFSFLFLCFKPYSSGCGARTVSTISGSGAAQPLPFVDLPLDKPNNEEERLSGRTFAPELHRQHPTLFQPSVGRSSHSYLRLVTSLWYMQ